LALAILKVSPVNVKIVFSQPLWCLWFEKVAN